MEEDPSKRIIMGIRIAENDKIQNMQKTRCKEFPRGNIQGFLI
jgi:hypothetical protein